MVFMYKQNMKINKYEKKIKALKSYLIYYIIYQISKSNNLYLKTLPDFSAFLMKCSLNFIQLLKVG